MKDKSETSGKVGPYGVNELIIWGGGEEDK